MYSATKVRVLFRLRLRMLIRKLFRLLAEGKLLLDSIIRYPGTAHIYLKAIASAPRSTTKAYVRHFPSCILHVRQVDRSTDARRPLLVRSPVGVRVLPRPRCPRARQQRASSFRVIVPQTRMQFFINADASPPPAQVPYVSEPTITLPNERWAGRPCGGGGRDGEGRSDCHPASGLVRCVPAGVWKRHLRDDLFQYGGHVGRQRRANCRLQSLVRPLSLAFSACCSDPDASAVHTSACLRSVLITRYLPSTLLTLLPSRFLCARNLGSLYRTYFRPRATSAEIVRVSHYFICFWAVWAGCWATIVRLALRPPCSDWTSPISFSCRLKRVAAAPSKYRPRMALLRPVRTPSMFLMRQMD